MQTKNIYLYFHSKILSWKGNEMSEKEFMSSFFQWRIPKNLRPLIVEDMKKLDLIKVEKKTVYLNDYYFEKEIKGKKVDFKDEDTKAGSPYLMYSQII